MQLGLLLILLVQRLLREVQLVPLLDEVFQIIEHILLDQSQVDAQLLAMDETLDCMVKANSLYSDSSTKFLWLRIFSENYRPNPCSCRKF